MSDYHSNEYYYLREIPGKGFGAIAKKDIKIGTLILKERPQIFDNGNQTRYSDMFIDEERRKGLRKGVLETQDWLQWLERGIPEWICSVMASYDQMRKMDQEEFLKLNNKIQKHDLSSEKDNDEIHKRLKKVIGQTFRGTDIRGAEYDKVKILSIAEIFLSNLWNGKRGIRPSVNYVEIHTSKFNHSCNPNSRVFTECEYFMVRAIRDIKVGEEITNAYKCQGIIMKRREERQKFARDSMNFICMCELCLVEDTEKDAEIFNGFQKLKKDAQDLNWMYQSRGVLGYSMTKDISKEITYYKKMYIIAKKQNVSLNYIYREVLLGGLAASIKGCENAKSQKDKEKFKKDFKKFSEDAKSIDDLLGVTTEERWAWQSFQEPFEKFLTDNNM